MSFDLLPLALRETPPGLEIALMQEGIPFRRLDGNAKFILFDGREVRPRRVHESLAPGQVAIDIDAIRREAPNGDPFAALIDTRASRKTWTIDGVDLTERVARANKPAARRFILDRLREQITRAGGLWARIARYPYPYRSAFHFRADLDEPYPDDYFRFARARGPIDDCSTAFVSTAAYGRNREVLDDLKRIDAQSHGHHHVVSRDEDANRANLVRADRILRDRGIIPRGFAAPEGRWNVGLDRAIEDLGYEYSSDFHLGHDDDPSFPWRDGRFSRVLQVPVHPICEGLFLDAGATDPGRIADHLIATVRAKVAAGESAFVYGHPERRLGRFPEVVAALANAAEALPGDTWRVTMNEFARWWRRRAEQSWSLADLGRGRYEARFESWDTRHPIALEVVRGDSAAALRVEAPRQDVRPATLRYERIPARWEPPPSRLLRPRVTLKGAVRAALDWETVTPWEELPEAKVGDRLKKRLRRMRAGTSS